MLEPAEPEIEKLLFSGVVVLLLLALALVFFFLVYQKKLIRQQQALQKIQSAYQKELLTATIESEERERKRIGIDLHDEIGSSLSAAKMLMSQLPSPASAPDQALMANIKSILSNSVEDLRNISQNLYPTVLAQFGLVEALHNLGFIWTDAQNVDIAVHAELHASLTDLQELALYRIVQELVNNAMKHAQASRITIALTQHPACLQLVVMDNGRGFDYAQMRQHPKAGLGLKSLEARVSLIGATLHLESSPNHGTRILIEMPLPPIMPSTSASTHNESCYSSPAPCYS